MSMISSQIQEIKKVSEWYKESNAYLQKVLLQAADTIEVLSAKLAKENMERSDRYYNGGWILCSDRLPKKVDRYYIVSVKSTVSDFEYTRPALYDKDGFATRIDEEPIAWQPLPEPYKPQ